MNAQTNNLAALLRKAFERNALVAVIASDFLQVLQDMDKAMDVISFSASKPGAVKEHLFEGMQAVANLLFVLKSKSRPPLPGNCKCLTSRAEMLHHKITRTLSWYCNIPGTYQHDLLPVKTLQKQLAALGSYVKEDGSVNELFALLQPGITELQQTKILPCHRWVWWSKCYAAIANAGSVDTGLMENILIGINFNAPAFISWLLCRLDQAIQAETAVAQKLEYLATQLLKYELLPLPGPGYLPAERSVKNTMIPVLKTKLKLCNAICGGPGATPKMPPSKWNTALSVPQLALFIRLLVDTNLISENNVAGLLKNIAAIVSTSKTASISAESLRVNYYTPNSAAKTIVKEYLLLLLNRLRQY